MFENNLGERCFFKYLSFHFDIIFVYLMFLTMSSVKFQEQNEWDSH